MLRGRGQGAGDMLRARNRVRTLNTKHSTLNKNRCERQEDSLGQGDGHCAKRKVIFIAASGDSLMENRG